MSALLPTAERMAAASAAIVFRSVATDLAVAFAAAEGPIHIEFERLARDRPLLEVAAIEAVDANDLGVIARREDLVGVHEILDRKRHFANLEARLAQQADDAGAGDAGKEGAVGDRRRDDAVLDHEDVGRCRLR